MNLTLIPKYRRVLEQGFMPICVGDRFQIGTLAEVSIAAGARAIEITCRRPAALREIQVVKKRHPDLLLLAGSVVDDGPLLRHLQRRQPDMPSISQLLDAGADGIVSALPLKLETISHLAKTHLVIPGIETPSEAVQAIENGAHFAKLFTADLMGGPNRVRRLTSPPTHGLLPLFVTGGITEQRIHEYLSAGVAMLGSGWDVVLGEHYAALQDQPVQAQMVSSLKRFFETFRSSRESINEQWRLLPNLADAPFLESLTHFVPEAWICSREEM